MERTEVDSLQETEAPRSNNLQGTGCHQYPCVNLDVLLLIKPQMRM